MKLTRALFLVTLISPAFAQDVTTSPLDLAYTALRSQKEIMLDLNGTQQVGNKTTQLYSDAFFLWDPLNVDAGAKAEINDYSNGAHTHRIVADGTTLWSYDFIRNSYSAAKYGSYAGKMPENFRATMFQELTSASEGPATWLARLLREVFSGNVAQYREWMPGSTENVVSGGLSMKDPIMPSRIYQSGLSDEYIVHSYGSRLKRSLTFHLVWNDTTKTWNLTEIFYTDVQNFTPSIARTVDWKVDVYTGTLPASTNYVFVPPTSAQPIANPRSDGG